MRQTIIPYQNLTAYQSEQQVARLKGTVRALTRFPGPEGFHFYLEQLSQHGLIEEVDHLAQVSSSALKRSLNLSRKLAEHRLMLHSLADRFGPSFQASLNFDLLSPSPQLTRSERGSDTLAIVLPSHANNLMMSFPVVDLYLDQLGFDALYIKSTHCEIAYYEGYFGFGSSLETVADRLTNLIAQGQYKRVCICGASSGGFPALWLGARLKAAQVCVFGADITPTMRTKHLSTKALARHIAEDDITRLADLEAIGHIHAYAGSQRRRDVECLTHLEGRANVTAQLVPGVGHMVLLALIAKGYHFAELVG